MKPTERIRKIRERNDYSQDYMAAKLGMTQANYARIESAKTKLTLDRLESICRVLNVPVKDIIGEGTETVSADGIMNGVATQSDSRDSSLLHELKRELDMIRQERIQLLSIIADLSRQRAYNVSHSL